MHQDKVIGNPRCMAAYAALKLSLFPGLTGRTVFTQNQPPSSGL